MLRSLAVIAELRREAGILLRHVGKHDLSCLQAFVESSGSNSIKNNKIDSASVFLRLWQHLDSNQVTCKPH